VKLRKNEGHRSVCYLFLSKKNLATTTTITIAAPSTGLEGNSSGFESDTVFVKACLAETINLCVLSS